MLLVSAPTKWPGVNFINWIAPRIKLFALFMKSTQVSEFWMCVCTKCSICVNLFYLICLKCVNIYTFHEIDLSTNFDKFFNVVPSREDTPFSSTFYGLFLNHQYIITCYISLQTYVCSFHVLLIHACLWILRASKFFSFEFEFVMFLKCHYIYEDLLLF